MKSFSESISNFFVFPFPSKRVPVTPPEKKPGEVKLTDEEVNALFHII